MMLATISPVEDPASSDRHDGQEYYRRSSDDNFLPDIPRSDGAETFMKLCDAIARLLAAFSKQGPSPFKIFPSRTQDKASNNRETSPSNNNNNNDTTGIGSLDRQLTFDRLDMSSIVRTTDLDSALSTVADREGPSGDKRWEGRKERISNMPVRLFQ